MKKTTAHLAVIAFAATFSAASWAHPTRRYQLVNLDAAVGLQTTPSAINNAGVVALRAFENGRVVSLLYDSKSGQVIQRFPVENGLINAISDNGNVAGQGSFRIIGWFVVDGVAGTLPFP